MSEISDKINATITLEDILSDEVQTEDITAGLARACNSWYKIGLERQRREYKEELIKKIVYVSLHDGASVTTRDTGTDYITKEYLEELKQYFTDREFECELKEPEDRESYLIIRWGDDEE